MSLGFYEVASNPSGSTTNAYAFSNRTVAVRGSFDVDVIVTSLVVRTHSAATGDFKPVIYRISDSVRMGEGTPATLTTVAGTDFELVFNSPVTLVAGVTYAFGVHSTTSNIGNQSTNTYAAGSTKASTPAGVTWTRATVGYYNVAADSNPGNASTGEPFITVSFNGTNVPPVPTITFPAAYGKLTPVTSTKTFTWTVADSESNAQYRYQIDYRLRDSGGAWTSATVVSSTPSHTFAANTFTSGQEYEYRLRLDDNQGGGWGAYSAVRYFGAEIFPWIYGTETFSSGSNLGTSILVAHGDFEASNSIALGGWESNPAFGSLIQSTVARTTTKPDTGTYSLEVTLPTLASNQNTVANAYIQNLLTYGKLYRLTARVWMQTGGPDFRADMIYQPGQDAPINTTKNAWTTVTSTFVYTLEGNAFPAVKTEGAATSGMKMYVDNVILHEVGSTLSGQVTPVEVSGYDVQVRTADHVGYGPWSSTHTALVNPLSNKFVRVGGVWVVSTVQTKVSGVWQDVQPSKVKSGGVFV